MAPSGKQCEEVSEGRGRAKAGPNVWIVPITYVSHVRCFLQFAKQLARHGVTVTFFCTKDSAERIHGSVSAMLESWKREGLDLRLEFPDVSPLELADGENEIQRWVTAIGELEESFEVTLKRELDLGGQSKPTCVISDLWAPGVHERARKYDVPAWVFDSFSLSHTGAVVYLAQLESKGLLNLPSSPHLDKVTSEQLISLPALPLLRLRDIDECFFKGHPLYAQGSRNGPTVQKSEVVIFSTFAELETKALREMKVLLQSAATNEKREVGQVYTVGPTFAFASKGARAEEDQDNRHPCLKFLDKQAESSVLYVAFGNDWNHTPEQMLEIACGLENSQQPFICVLHAPKKTPQFPSGDMLDVITRERVTRTRDRGLFVPGWVPQLEILGHPSTGGFLSHCGQNSILESVSMGIPLLAWPLYFDQMLNTRSMVDEVQIALAITTGSHILEEVDRTEVETKVRALFHSEQGTTARNNARRMRQLALQSVGENGSSYKNMQALVARINGLAAGLVDCSTE